METIAPNLEMYIESCNKLLYEIRGIELINTVLIASTEALKQIK